MHRTAEEEPIVTPIGEVNNRGRRKEHF